MTTETIHKPLWRRLLPPIAGGALAGFIAAFGFLNLTDLARGEGLGPSREIAGLVGMLYALTGLSIVVGVLSPGIGAKFLNVEDADELREQRRMLSYSAIATILLGMALTLVALSGEGALVAASTGAIVAAVLVAIAVVLSVAMRRHTDELQRALSGDATASAFYLMALFGGGWAVLAHLGFTAGPAPLDWLTMFAASLLIGAFYQTARRGLMLRGPN
ncbi:MAG: hypothetical protein GW855_05105 [Erythrobacter sp.]|nr:hypothetical protein [Erythrobacter sp.]NCQ62712.1 hypothetical protein [Alphaproteobacteria bacterium]